MVISYAHIFFIPSLGTILQNTSYNQHSAIPAILNQSEKISVRINWISVSNPTPYEDVALGTCILKNYIIVVGLVGFRGYRSKPSSHGYVEILDKSTGKVLERYRDPNISVFLNCITYNDEIYVVGSELLDNHSVGVIYVFDSNLKLLRVIHDKYTNILAAITRWEGHAYLVGTGYEGNGTPSVVVEKRSLPELKLESEISISKGPCMFSYSIAVNPATGNVWIVGQYIHEIGISKMMRYTMIIILSPSLKPIHEIGYPENTRFGVGTATDIYLF